MKETRRLETKRFVLRSYGNGTAICLTCRSSRTEVFLQGDDALSLLDAMADLIEAKPHWDNDGVLGELWLDYLELASPVVA